MSVTHEIMQRTTEQHNETDHDFDSLLKRRFEAGEEGRYELIVGDKDMSAWLKTTPHKNSYLRIAIEDVEALAEAVGIVHGKVEGYFNKIPLTEPGLTLIARGTQPVKGDDARLVQVYKETQEESASEMDNADLRQVLKFTIVKKGETIAEKIPAISGTPGINVYGKAIPAQPGKDIVLIPGENVEVTEDGLRIKAAADGVLSVSGNRYSLTRLYEVAGDVDYSVGNIDFAGSVIVRGNVSPGFKITATESIDIEGSVDHASLEAGGDIRIHKGYYGDANTRIEAGGSLFVRSLENAKVKVINEVRAAHYIINCDISAGGSVVVEHQTKGRISGGRIISGDMVETFLLGSPAFTKTEVEIVTLSNMDLGNNYCFNMARFYEDAIEKTVFEIEHLRDADGARQLKAETVENIRSLQAKAAHYRKSLDKLLAVKGLYKTGSRGAPRKEIRVKGICFSGSTIKYSHSLMNFGDDRRAIVVRVKDEELAVATIA
ncbi:MAG: FapA family protein [bacterium]